jgi:hypothetical protein
MRARRCQVSRTSKADGHEYLQANFLPDAESKGVAPLDEYLTPAEQFETRERKQSMFQLSDDPFDVLANRHRSSISGATTGASAAATRRRSSAVAPDAAHAAAGHHHSGYDGNNNNLTTIESRVEPARNGESSGVSDTTRDSIDPVKAGNGEHTKFHDAASKGHNHGTHGLLQGQNLTTEEHHDPDSVAPHEVR